MRVPKPHLNPKEAAGWYGISVEDYLKAEAEFLVAAAEAREKIAFYQDRIDELYFWWECGGDDVETYILNHK